MLKTILVCLGAALLKLDMKVDQAFILLSTIILQQADRIAQLNLHAGNCYSQDFSPKFLCRFSLSGYTLSSLTKVGLFRDHLEIPDGGIQVFEDCPLLHKLKIHFLMGQSGLLKALCGLHIPFFQLTELSLYIHSSPHSMHQQTSF